MDSLRCLLYRFIAIGLSLWSGYELSAMCVWYAFPFGLTTAGLLYYVYYQKGLKRIEESAK